MDSFIPNWRAASVPRWRSHLQGWEGRSGHSRSAGFASKHSKYWTGQSSVLSVFGLTSDFFLADFDVRLRIGNMRSQLRALLETSSPASAGLPPPVPLRLSHQEQGKQPPFKQGKPLFQTGETQHLRRHQCNGATKSFAKILIKIGLGFLPTVSRQNPCLPATTPRKRQCLRCLGFETTLSGWAAVGHTRARAARLGTRLEQALLRCPIHTNTYASAVQTKEKSSLWLNLLIYRKWFEDNNRTKKKCCQPLRCIIYLEKQDRYAEHGAL